MDNCFKATIAFENDQWIPNLLKDFPDLIIYDASEKTPYTGPGTVVKIENRGFTRNWNRVFEDFLASDKQFIWMTNNDIDISTETYEKMINVITEDTRCAAVVASYYSHHQTLRNLGRGIRKVPFMEQTSPIYRKEAIQDLLKAVGYILYPPIKMGHGVDIISSWHLRNLGYHFLVIDDVSFYHHVAGNAKEAFGTKTNYTKVASEDRKGHIQDIIGSNWKKQLLVGFENENYKL